MDADELWSHLEKKRKRETNFLEENQKTNLPEERNGCYVEEAENFKLFRK